MMTIDVDSTADAFGTFYKCLDFFKRKPDKIRISSSGRGFHFIYFNEKNDYDIRRYLGDDEVRVRIDEASAFKPQQVLWDAKIKGEEIKEIKEISVEDFLILVYDFNFNKFSEIKEFL